MTEWERSREQEEFVRASILYRPSSSSLSSRFTRGKHQEDEDNVEVNQDQEVYGGGWGSSSRTTSQRAGRLIPGLCCRCQGDVDDKESAAKMKMFGKLTRETFEWHPDKLLCKRFNVPEPYPG